MENLSFLRHKQSGFSLLELLITVAIIGILAALGIINYGKANARTRQSEAKAALSTLFVAENSFFSEWSQYTVDLQNVGFGVFGKKLRYVTGFYSGTGCTGYNTTSGAPAEIITVDNTWSCGSNVNIPGPAQAQDWLLPSNITIVANQCTNDPIILPNTTSLCDATSGSQTFTAVSVGDPTNNPDADPSDGWTIGDSKKLSNTDSGIE